MPVVVLLSRELVKLQAISARADQNGDDYECGQVRDDEGRGYSQRRLNLDRVFSLWLRHASGGAVGQRCENPSRDPQHDKLANSLRSRPVRAEEQSSEDSDLEEWRRRLRGPLPEPSRTLQLWHAAVEDRKLPKPRKALSVIEKRSQIQALGTWAAGSGGKADEISGRLVLFTRSSVWRG